MMSVRADVTGIKPQASPKVIQTDLFQTKHFGLAIALRKALPLCLSGYLCICFLTKCFTGTFPATLSPQAEMCWVGGCKEEGKRSLSKGASSDCLQLLSPTEDARKPGQPAPPAGKSSALGSPERWSSFPKMLRRTCIRIHLLFSSICAPPSLLKISGHFKRPWV